MSAEIYSTDGIAYQGETPWHQIGDKIPAGASIDDAMAIACKRRDGKPGIWEVQKLPIQIVGGKAISDHYATVRDDTGDALGVVGSKYEPLTNAAAADWYRPILADGLVDVEVAGTLNNGRVVWILGAVKGTESKIGTGDSIRRYTLLAHGHDGSISITPGLTDVRVANGGTRSVGGRTPESRLSSLAFGSNGALLTRGLDAALQLSDAGPTADVDEVMAALSANQAARGN